jgi:tetratricopeptide (TPR) repeat protein
VGLALEALEALEPDIVIRGPISLLLTRLEEAIRLAETVTVAPEQLAAILAVRGRAHLEAGEPEAARRDLEQARVALRASGDVAGEKRVLVDLSIVARHQGEVAAAWEFIQEAQQRGSGGDPWLEAYAQGHLGLLEQVRSGAEAALPHLVAAHELFHEVGDVTHEVAFTTYRAVALGETGRLGEAVALVTEAMTRAASVGDQAGHTLARMHLGCFLLEEGRAHESREHLLAAVRMGRQLGARLLEGRAMGELGRAEQALGDLAEARHWLAEAVSALEGAARWQALRFAAHRAAVEAVLGDQQAARASFEALEEEPAVRADPSLRELVTRLRAAAAPGLERGTLLSETEAEAAPAPGAHREARAVAEAPAPSA